MRVDFDRWWRLKLRHEFITYLLNYLMSMVSTSSARVALFFALQRPRCIHNSRLLSLLLFMSREVDRLLRELVLSEGGRLFVVPLLTVKLLDIILTTATWTMTRVSWSSVLN